MNAEGLLSRLDGVRSTGLGRWLARCPAHDDKRASLSVRELDNKLLVHDFAGCAVHEILAAVGLDFADLFTARTSTSGTKAKRHRFNAMDMLKALSFEADLVAVAAARLGNGQALADADRQHLLTAAARIGNAVHEALLDDRLYMLKPHETSQAYREMDDFKRVNGYA